MADLFAPDPTDDAAHPVNAAAPLAVRMRPASLDEVIGQRHLLTPGSPLVRMAADTASASGAGPASVILWGPPGTGKTTIAQIVARGPGRAFVELSAVTAGVKDVRREMEEARDRLALYRRQTVLFLDEIHRFTKAQQDALLPGVENRWVILVAATTENPSFSVVAPLLSRSLLLTLRALDDDDIRAVVDRALTDPRGLAGSVDLREDARDHLVRLSGGDARRALTALEAAAGAGLAAGDGTIGIAEIETALDVAAVRYDRDGDQHYDVASALIKSIRGSDVDAAMHYLARMLEAGEDPRFVARRLMISASEDIGTADPTALQTAVAAAQSVAMIGMPEARIVLAHAVAHLATAPKSNAACTAIAEATADVRGGRGGAVPAHLRDAHYPGAAALGHGTGYRYAHDDPRGVVEQQYAPDDLAGVEYYRPTDRGAEREIGARLARLRAVLRGDHRPDRGAHPSR